MHDPAPVRPTVAPPGQINPSPLRSDAFRLGKKHEKPRVHLAGRDVPAVASLENMTSSQLFYIFISFPPHRLYERIRIPGEILFANMPWHRRQHDLRQRKRDGEVIFVLTQCLAKNGGICRRSK